MESIEITVLGVMSGTSLDGIDLAIVKFIKTNLWSFEVLETSTVPYPPEWELKLRTAIDLATKERVALDREYTLFLGERIASFLAQHQDCSIDFVSSHGHTVLHQPQHGITYQIGNLPLLAKQLQRKVICDFRTADVALKGQGAPLVPGAEIHLFNTYDACVNLGGFANISILTASQPKAYDICAVNIVMNSLAKKLGLDFDRDGELARAGKKIPTLLSALQQLPFYKKATPKSLGIEWVNAEIVPLLQHFNRHRIEDLLHTYSFHIAQEISRNLPLEGKVLFSGGGAYNLYLMEMIERESSATIVLPSSQIIEFKEAIAFAFLGVLRDLDQPNCFAQFTGSKMDHSSGKIFYP